MVARVLDGLLRLVGPVPQSEVGTGNVPEISRKHFRFDPAKFNGYRDLLLNVSVLVTALLTASTPFEKSPLGVFERAGVKTSVEARYDRTCSGEPLDRVSRHCPNRALQIMTCELQAPDGRRVSHMCELQIHHAPVSARRFSLKILCREWVRMCRGFGQTRAC